MNVARGFACVMNSKASLLRCRIAPRNSKQIHVPRGFARWVAAVVQGSSGQGCRG